MSEERICRNDTLHCLPRLLEARCRSIRPSSYSIRTPPQNQLWRLGSYNLVAGLFCVGRSIRVPAATTMGQNIGSVHRPCQ